MKWHALWNVTIIVLAIALTGHLESSAAERPDIIYIMSDDMGYSDIGCYGSEIDTPNLNNLAAHGLRFTQFYNTARCCPTRACLITGLYPHQAGIGHMTSDRGYDGYRGDLNRHCMTIAEVLKTAGYGTYMTGKWHVTKELKPKTDADKYNWPCQRGFDRFYGTIIGAGSYFDPYTLTRNNEYISPHNDPEYRPDQFYYTNAIADQAARFIREHNAQKKDQPFFLYITFTAAHWPMQALAKDIAKYRGKYDAGYQAVRDARYQRMLKLGVIDAESTVNWPIDDAWKEKEYLQWDIHNMEVYAAMIDCMDRGIGRIVTALQDTGRLDNTLLCFLQDNGGCAENYGRGGVGRSRADQPELAPLPPEYIQPAMTPAQNRAGYKMRTGKGSMAGPDDTAVAYGRGWATVSNTPFREYKHWVHEGGISTPLIAHWPAHIKRHGALEETPAHLIDLMATAVDVSGAHYPTTFHGGQEITPMEGKSLVPAFDGKGIEREALYWEHEGNRAIRVGDWKLVAKGAHGPWELYNIAHDRSEQNDLAAAQPERVQHMAAMWQAWAERAHVLPLNPGSKKNSQRKAAFNRKQRQFKLANGADLDQYKAPYVKGRGIEAAATITPSSKVANGVIVAQGGTAHGWSLYLKQGTLCFATTHSGQRNVIESATQIEGNATVGVVLDVQGNVRLRVNDREAGEGHVPGPLLDQPQDGLQVGQDKRGAVGDYAAPNTFAGRIDMVTVQLRVPAKK